MFDAPPPNLPVAPAPFGAGQAPAPSGAGQAPTVPPPAPLSTSVPPPGPMPPRAPAPPPAPPFVPPLTTSSKKEPEDIFAAMDKGPMPSAPSSVFSEDAKSRFPLRILLISLAGLVVLAVIGFVLWRFVVQPKRQVATVVRPSSTKEKKKEVVEEPLPAPESPRAPVTIPPPAVPIPAPPAPKPALVPPPPASPTEGVDTDSDGLTDVEEPFYDADPQNPDTDGDGYRDGMEVRNLFDPSKKNGTLADAKYMSRLFGKDVGIPVFSLLAPKPWSLAILPTNEIRAALSTGSATRFVFEWKKNREHLPIDAWIAHEGISASTSLHSIKTKSGIEGRQSSDGLTTYLFLTDSVLIVTYDLNGDTSYDYRASYEMVIQSIAIKT